MDYIEKFKINMDEIPEEVLMIRDKLTEKQKVNLKKAYGSCENLIYSIYYLRFVKKFEVSEIAYELDVSPQNIHMYLYNFHWAYSTDYNRNNELYYQDLETLHAIYDEACIEVNNIVVSKHKKLQEILLNVKKLRSDSYKWCGCSNQDEYIKLMYILSNSYDLTTVQLALMFDVPFTSIQSRMKRIGLEQNVQSAIEKKKRNSRQNYEKSINSGKRTRANSVKKSFDGGSKNENFVRAKLNNSLYEYFNSGEYEIIVGLSNTGICGAKEIDIPVVIIRKSNNSVYKFAIEYNGEKYHNPLDDKLKKDTLNSLGWHYLSFVEDNNTRYSNNRDKLERHIADKCSQIYDLVVNP